MIWLHSFLLSSCMVFALCSSFIVSSPASVVARDDIGGKGRSRKIPCLTVHPPLSTIKRGKLVGIFSSHATAAECDVTAGGEGVDASVLIFLDFIDLGFRPSLQVGAAAIVVVPPLAFFVRLLLAGVVAEVVPMVWQNKFTYYYV